MKKGKLLICFIGIDGSGKTTLANALALAMRERGIRSQYVYNRFEPLLLKPFIWLGKALFLRGKDMFKEYDEYSSTKRRLFQNRLISFFYEYSLTFDYLLQAMVKIRLPLMRGRNLVCDRYIYDTVITDLAPSLSYSEEKIEKMLKRFTRLFPVPELVFLVDVPEEIALQRKNDIPSINYLKERRRLYLLVKKHRDIIFLDGSRDLEELMNITQNEVVRLCASL